VYGLLLLIGILMRQNSIELVKKHCVFHYVKCMICQTETCQFALRMGLLLVNLGSIKTLSKNRLRPLPLKLNS